MRLAWKRAVMTLPDQNQLPSWHTNILSGQGHSTDVRSTHLLLVVYLPDMLHLPTQVKILHQKEMEFGIVHSRYTSMAVMFWQISFGNGRKFQDRFTASTVNQQPFSPGRNAPFQSHVWAFLGFLEHTVDSLFENWVPPIASSPPVI